VSFEAELKMFEYKAILAVEKTCRAIAIALFSSIIMSSPFLTGRLASNWRCSLGSPLLGEVPSYGGSEGSVKSAAITAVVNALASMAGDFRAFLTNSLPYVKRIEYEGWSKVKAPAGMVRINVARIEAIVLKAAAENRI
jgi:hypothetical protein